MASDVLVELSQDELDLLREVCQVSDDIEVHTKKNDLSINVGDLSIDHLLSMSESLTLEANLGRHQLIFSPSVIQDRYGNATMDMGYPVVYETEGVNRNKRVKPAHNEVAVINAESHFMSKAIIKDISTSGLSLSLPINMLPIDAIGETSALTITLPCFTPIQITGVIVRSRDEVLAIRFEEIDQQSLNIIKSFVYEKTTEKSLLMAASC